MPDMPDTTNRWESILSDLGIEMGDGHHRPCPLCGGKDRFRWDNKDGRGTYYCNQCGAGDGWQLVQKYFGIPFAETIEKVNSVYSQGTPQSKPPNKRVANISRMNEMHRLSKPLNGQDPASRYLSCRGLSTFPPTLRYYNNCYEPETRGHLDATLATFSGVDGKAATIQVTYLSKLAIKAEIKTPKRTMTPKYPMAGGAVRLFEVGKTLGIAEGIETAICGHEMLNGIPVWATLSSSLMKTFEPPIEVENLIILGDNDLSFTGQQAAYNLANRVYNKVKVEVLIPDEVGDWLDMLLRGAL